MKNLFLPLFTLSLLFSPALLVAQNQYCEQNGIVIVEAESEATVALWSLQTTTPTPTSQLSPPAFTGAGFLMWHENCGVPANNWSGCTGSISGNNNNAITYRVYFNTTGRYRFQIRSWQPNIQYTSDHAANTENNDVFVRFQDGVAVRKKGPNPDVVITNTWVKIYQNTINSWTWNTSTVDSDPHNIFLDVATPGVYRIQLAGRSKLFAVDRFTLWHTTLGDQATATAFATPASPLSCSATYYQDLDGDTYGNSSVTSNTALPGYVTVGGDCNDNNAAINPGATEICGNAVDENCDGTAVAGQTWYQDNDLDGFGSNSATLSACTQPTGYIASGGDCDDTDPFVNPYQPETQADGVDNNCNGQTDESNTLVAIYLINADTDTELGELVNGSQVILSQLPTNNLNIEARRAGTVGSVVFALTGAMTRNQTETALPYALYGDVSGNYNAWNPIPGSYNLSSRAFTGSGGSGSLITEVNFGFTVANSGTLPVEWAEFTAVPQAGKILLNWNTLSEVNNQGFYVERSKDARMFESIHFTAGIGNSQQMNAYKYTDQQPYTGISYYRIKQVDVNGTFTFSPVVEVFSDKGEMLVMYPNPLTDSELTLEIGDLSFEQAHLSIVNLLGQVVVSQSLRFDNSKATVNLDAFEPGMYFVNVRSSNGETRSSRLIVK